MTANSGDTISLEVFSGLVHGVYQAGIDPRKWSVFIEDLAGVLSDSIVCLQAHDATAGANLGFVSSKADPDFLDSYTQYYSAQNIWAKGMVDAPLGVVVQSDEICPREDLRKTEFYNDYLRKQDLIAAVGVVLQRSANRVIFLSGNIRDRAADEIQTPMQRMFELLGPHISRAFALNRFLAPASEGEDLRAATERSTEAVFLIGRAGRLVHANRVGTDLLRQADTLAANQDGGLQFLDPQADQALQSSLEAFAKHGFSQTGGVITGKRRNGLSLCATISPIHNQLSHTILDQIFEDRPVAMLVIQNPPVRNDAAILLDGYRLTAAEMALAVAIAQGRSLREYADERELSVHTVRTQLKSVFAKTHTNRQSQLAALAMRR